MKFRSTLSTILTAAALAATLGLAGCAALGVSGGSSHYLAPDNADRASVIAEAIDLLGEKVGEDAQIADFFVSDVTVSVNAIDPKSPKELNRWTIRDGAHDGDVPVDYGSDYEALQDNLFSLSDVDPAVVAQVIEDAPGTSDFDGLAVYSLTLSFPAVSIDEVGWDLEFLASMRSDRDTDTAWFDIAGKPITD